MPVTTESLQRLVEVSAHQTVGEKVIPVSEGAYILLCLGMVYVGRSKDIRARWNKHLSDLRRGKHANKGLQKCFNSSRCISINVVYVGPSSDIIEGRLLRQFVGNQFCLNLHVDPKGPKGYRLRRLSSLAHLTQETAEIIRSRYNAPNRAVSAGPKPARDSMQSLANEFRLSRSSVRSIIRNQTYTRAKAHNWPQAKG